MSVFHVFSKMSDYGDGSDDKQLYVPVSRQDFSDEWKLSTHATFDGVQTYCDSIIFTHHCYDWRYQGTQTFCPLEEDRKLVYVDENKNEYYQSPDSEVCDHIIALTSGEISFTDF